MKVKRFEDLIAWQKAQDLTVKLYSIFSNNKDYSFRNQILRAAISISNNIAEGFERNTDIDFSRILFIAKGSCSEVKSMLYLSKQLDYIKSEQAEEFINKCSEIMKILNGLIKSIKK